MTTSFVVKDKILLDTNGLQCPHCEEEYSPEDAAESCPAERSEGLLTCDNCNGHFEWVRWTQIKYSTRAVSSLN